MNHANGHTESPTRRIVLRVFRYSGEPGDSARFDTFALDVPAGTTVLNALFEIQQAHDPSLAFPFSCRGAVCGSCGMTIDGRCALACRTQLWSLPGDEVVIEPLPNLDVVRDLIVDLRPFWENYRSVRPWLHEQIQRAESEALPERENLQKPRHMQRIEQYTNCILCACCYGACPVLKRQPEYLGPAAMAKLERFVGDTRDRRSLEVLDEVDSEGGGVWGCDTVFRCIDACPKDVRPTDGIAALRRRLIGRRLRGRR